MINCYDCPMHREEQSYCVRFDEYITDGEPCDYCDRDEIKINVKIECEVTHCTHCPLCNGSEFGLDCKLLPYTHDYTGNIDGVGFMKIHEDCPFLAELDTATRKDFKSW